MSNLSKDAGFKELKSRLRERLGGVNSLSSVSDWICEHTYLNDSKFSFREHEFQKAIADDLAPTLIAQKPTQVGFTELSVRIMLALCGIRRNFKVIYILPSATFASEFSKTRVDPVIESSPRLSGMVVAGSNGAMMKRIGTSIMYMGGAATKSQAISRPADALIMDEIDFANQEVLTSYQGRTRHSKDPFLRKFGTPTVSNFGVNAELLKSDRLRYSVKCEHCSKWSVPSWNTHVRVPGYEGKEFKGFGKEHLNDASIRAHEAYLECEYCKKSLNHSLLSPDRRLWVPTNNSIQLVRGYEIKPFDLPTYNTIPKLVSDIAGYADEEDYWNFVQGETSDSDENQVSTDLVSRGFVLPALDNIEGLCMGVDVGAKKVHVTIGKDKKVHWYKTLYIQDGEFLPRIITLFKQHNCVQGVIDIGPDYSLSRGLYTEFGELFTRAVYVKGAPQDPDYFKVKENEGVVTVQRTKAFDLLVKDLNKGQYQFANMRDKADFLTHLQGMKKVKQDDSDTNTRQAQWIKTGEDHFFHSLQYLQVAIALASGEHAAVSSSEVPVLPEFAGVGLGSLRSNAAPKSSRNSELKSIYERFGLGF